MNNLFDPLESAGKKQLTIFIGYDSREDICAKILAHTIRNFKSDISYNIIPLVYSQFTLAETVEVTSAEMVNGMLKVWLEDIIPDEQKPRKVKIK